jgi:hypothetical protein
MPRIPENRGYYLGCILVIVFYDQDNIVTTLGNEEYVSAVIKEEMQKHIGAEPSLSIELLEPKKSMGILRSMELKVNKITA